MAPIEGLPTPTGRYSHENFTLDFDPFETFQKFNAVIRRPNGTEGKGIDNVFGLTTIPALKGTVTFIKIWEMNPGTNNLVAGEVLEVYFFGISEGGVLSNEGTYTFTLSEEEVRHIKEERLKFEQAKAEADKAKAENSASNPPANPQVDPQPEAPPTPAPPPAPEPPAPAVEKKAVTNIKRMFSGDALVCDRITHPPYKIKYLWWVKELTANGEQDLWQPRSSGLPHFILLGSQAEVNLVPGKNYVLYVAGDYGDKVGVGEEARQVFHLTEKNKIELGPAPTPAPLQVKDNKPADTVASPAPAPAPPVQLPPTPPAINPVPPAPTKPVATQEIKPINPPATDKPATSLTRAELLEKELAAEKRAGELATKEAVKKALEGAEKEKQEAVAAESARLQGILDEEIRKALARTAKAPTPTPPTGGAGAATRETRRESEERSTPTRWWNTSSPYFPYAALATIILLAGLCFLFWHHPWSGSSGSNSTLTTDQAMLAKMQDEINRLKVERDPATQKVAVNQAQVVPNQVLQMETKGTNNASLTLPSNLRKESFHASINMVGNIFGDDAKVNNKIIVRTASPDSWTRDWYPTMKKLCVGKDYTLCVPFEVVVPPREVLPVEIPAHCEILPSNWTKLDCEIKYEDSKEGFTFLPGGVSDRPLYGYETRFRTKLEVATTVRMVIFPENQSCGHRHR